MEVFRSEDFYIFVQDDVSLWWSRNNGEFISKSAWDLSGIQDIECLGMTHAIVGKIEHESVYDPRLMIVKDCSPVGNLYDDHIIYKIKSICLLTLGTEETELNLSPCKKHSSASSSKTSSTVELAKAGKKDGSKGLFENSMFVNKTWGAVKSAGNTIKNTTQQAAAIATSQVKQTVNKSRDSKERDRLERRITDELHKIFDDTESFYFCRTADITSSLQRLEKAGGSWGSPGRWGSADDRFFWNKHMLKDILEIGSPLCDPWVVPIIQGHVKVRRCEVDAGECSRHFNTESLRGKTEEQREVFTLSLVSRRSRHMAGTRYKRRGVDDNGYVANYVETEQSLVHRSHRVSFLQVRGSAPLYWSQPGHKYRPPPRLDKGEQETQIAFDKHFDKEKEIYGPVCIVNLVEQAGREKVIWEAYSNHVYTYNSPDIVYATFDFHEYCRGMHFENVALLVNALTDIIADMGYCWRDPQGYICRQNGVFRVNCIDCLDRTNVVQTALAKAVLKLQVTRLGLSGPDWPLPAALRAALHELWADNGDIISRQYAGTNALKGDYTRTGERKFTGIMKDGMNSANRYYIQHFADTFRQCCLDLLLGVPLNDTVLDRELDMLNDLRTVGNIACDAIVPAIIEIPPQTQNEIPPYYVQALRDELLLMNVAYGLSSYYLSRFKDAFRQATIDLMLGSARTSDLTLQNQQEAEAEEEERNATADHVRQLIDDCKKLLLSDSSAAQGAWGLIDADSGTGDPYETEMDSIVILTSDSYLVADYDDQSDRVTKFQLQSLRDLTAIEFGILESSSQISLTNLKSLGGGKRAADGAPCIRFHYRVEGQDGYFHTFRSTNLRFFNNMAVYIKTNEEIHESLRSICECFLVAMEVGGLSRVPFKQGGKLDRRKSKIRPTTGGGGGRSALYLELSGLPGLTRNLSETQLAIKTAGSKALTNMTEQFSKLNKLGHTLNPRNRNESSKTSKSDTTGKTTFTMGKSSLRMSSKRHHKSGGHSDCTSSDNSSDEDEGKTNIFEPTLDNLENCVRYVGDNPMLKSTTEGNKQATTMHLSNIQQSDVNSEAYLMENPLYSSKIDTNTSSSIDPENYQSEYLPRKCDDLNLVNPNAQQEMLAIEKSRSNSDVLSCNSVTYNIQTPALKLNPFDMDSDACGVAKTMGNEYFDAIPNRSATPEITINFDGASSTKWEPKIQPPSSLKLNQKLSHSSGEVDVNTGSDRDGDLVSGNDSSMFVNADPINSKEGGQQVVRSSSQHDMNLNISQSQSESALRQLKNITSPVASATKDLVLSPFSKFAKGMQNLGANLDPRKGKGGPVRQITEAQHEEHKKLQEKWSKCNTKLIAL